MDSVVVCVSTTMMMRIRDVAMMMIMNVGIMMMMTNNTDVVRYLWIIYVTRQT